MPRADTRLYRQARVKSNARLEYLPCQLSKRYPAAQLARRSLRQLLKPKRNREQWQSTIAQATPFGLLSMPDSRNVFLGQQYVSLCRAASLRLFSGQSFSNSLQL